MTDKKNIQNKSKNNSTRNEYKEEVSMEMLAERALAETLREGGAFSRKNDDRFKI
ncbi:hypothetical protein [Bacillus sp. 1P02SD]|uniref:hypothetical protein n=1 Tax=Bacillus sp. 1P02SD TaxID=3132264 RepID=UPI0039A14304